MAVYKYQVWSSVLGQAVATMDPSGNQIENRIYAGSTLIATARGRSTTGTSADDAIDFHVKESVTNTEVTYAYNATTSNWAAAEQEPFGQNISSIDPYIEEWNNYAQVLNGAQDPEWQCTLHKMMNGEFTSMPTHCAKAAWESEFVIFGTAKNKSLESLKKMMDTPLQKPSIPGVESETRDNLALAAKATFKPDGDKPDGNCKREPNGRFLEGCQNDPNNPAEVESIAAPGDVDASIGPPEMVLIPIPPDIKDRVKNRLNKNNGACNDFFTKLIQEASQYTPLAANKTIVRRDSLSIDRTGGEKPYATDGIGVLNKVTILGVNELKVGGKAVSGTISGSIATNDAVVEISLRGYNTAGAYKGQARAAIATSHDWYVDTAIHELVHHAGYHFGDQLLAYAASQMGETTSRSVPSKIQEGPWSTVLHDVLMKYCR